jgi:hypothetical protein
MLDHAALRLRPAVFPRTAVIPAKAGTQYAATSRLCPERLPRPLRRPGLEPGPISVPAISCRAVRQIGPGSYGRGDAERAASPWSYQRQKVAR